MMICQFFFVLFYLPIEFVYQGIDGRIHVFLNCIRVDPVAADVDSSFCLVMEFFHCQDTMNIGDVIETTFETY